MHINLWHIHFFFCILHCLCDVMWLMACRLVIYFLNKMMNFQKHQFGWTGHLNSGFNYFISYFWRIVYGTLAHYCTSVCLCCILLLEFETAELEMKKHSVRGIVTVLLYSTCMWVVPDASSSALESCSQVFLAGVVCSSWHRLIISQCCDVLGGRCV